ncbi:hypothetical protein AVEN_221760-1 [Araneus ventricosus]|uniref:Uncharacterized protein n=1 Tax=Araneus ventricosus TaxID=182803 RepID=A0A4Y2FQ85_ARAVE|nr:hypothetical protein AVEN_221760-1 [Araneus ventricosus]
MRAFGTTICLETQFLFQFSSVIFTSCSAVTRGLFWDGPRNFEPWSDDEEPVSTLSKLPRHTNGSTFCPGGFGMHQARLLGGSSIEPGFELGTLRLRNRDLSTRPQRPPQDSKSKILKKLIFDA